MLRFGNLLSWIVVALLASSAFAQEGIEGDTVLGRRMVGYGEIIDDAITAPGEQHEYFFVAGPGDIVYIDRITATTAGQLNWHLSDAYGRIIAKDYSTLNDLGPVTLLGGTYSLLVLGEDGTGTGIYQIQIVEASPLSSSFVVGGPEIVDSIATPASRIDYVFTADPGVTLFIDNTGSGTSAVNWELTDAYGLVLLSTTNLADQSVGPLVGGDYTLSVVSRLGGTASYSFQVSTLSMSESSTAIDTPESGTITTPGEVHTYTFTAAASQRIVVDETSPSASTVLNWKFEDVYGRVVQAQTTNLKDIGPLTLMGGDYRLSVISEGSGTGDYAFTIRECQDDMDSVLFDEHRSASIAITGQRDIYAFTAASDTLVYFDRLSTTSPASHHWEAYDALGNTVFSSTTMANTGPLPISAGAYTLSIGGDTGVVGDYEFTIHEVVDKELTAALGDTLSDSIDAPGQQVNYAFSVPAFQVIDLDVTATSSVLDFILRDSAGRALLSTTTFVDQLAIELVGGDYTLTIDGESDATGAFEFTLVDSGIASFTAAGATAPIDTPIAGSIAVSGEVDDYLISLATPQMLFFDLTLGASNLQWTLVDPAGRPVFDAAASSVVSQNQGPLALAAGDYQLSLSATGGATPSYGFTIVDVVDTSPGLALDVPTTATTPMPGATIRYGFSLASDTRIYVDVTSGTPLADWTLVRDGGTVVFGPIAASSDRGPLSLSAGDYTLTFDADHDDTPSATFEFATVNDVVDAIVLAIPAAGTIATPGATHAYTFSASEGQSLYFDLIVGSAFLDWSLVDPVGESVFGPTQASQVVNHDQGPLQLAAGEYTILFDAVNSQTPSFEFQIVEAIDTTESLALGSELSGAMVAGQVRHFTLDLLAPTRLHFDDREASSGIGWSLRDEAGFLVFNDGMGSPSASDRGPIDVGPGSYDLQLTAGSGDTFTFNVHAVVDSLDALVIDTPELVTLAGVADTASFEFEAPAGSTIFDILSTSSNLRWTLDDPAGESGGLFTDANADSPTNGDRGPFFLQPGIYRIEFHAINQATPSNEFVMRSGVAAEPVVVDPSWSMTRRYNFGYARSAHFNPIDGALYVGSRFSSDGLFRIEQSGVAVGVQASSGPVAGVAVSPAGDVFFTEDGNGRIRKLGVGNWVLAFGTGDDDPVGLAFAPSDYSGPLPIAGLGLVVDMGIDGEDGIWSFSPDVAEGEMLVYPDSGVLERAVDVTISPTDVFIAELGPEGGDGVIYRLDPGEVLVDIGAIGLQPAAITFDAASGGLFVVDLAGARVVAVDPMTGAVSDIVNGLILPEDAPWTGIDATPDGRRIFVTVDNTFYEFTRCDVASFGGDDCNGNGILDACDIALGTEADCNGNGIPDSCDIASGTSLDLNFDGKPDECSPCSLLDLVFIMDTSLSMNDDAEALCALLPSIVDRLGVAGVDIDSEILGTVNMPGGDYDCLTGNIRDLLGGEVAVDCTDLITQMTEDWGRGTKVVAELYPWREGARRVAIVVTDEGPHCGDGIDTADYLDVDDAIAAALEHQVIVSTITGNGSSAEVIALAAELALGSGGVPFSIESSVEEIADAVEGIVLTSCPCGAGLADVSPASGSTYPIGTSLTLSGRATSLDPARPVVAVLINGNPADSIDASGRFFESVTLAAGENEYTIEIVQSCGSTTSGLTLVGIGDATSDAVTYSDVTTMLSANYSATTYVHSTRQLHVDVEACNTAETPVATPVLMVIDAFTEPGVSAAYRMVISKTVDRSIASPRNSSCSAPARAVRREPSHSTVPVSAPCCSR